MLECHTATWLSVISFVYVTSHGFILLRSGPSAAMLVSPAPQYEPAKNHYQSNPTIGSHYYSTLSRLSLRPGKAFGRVRESCRGLPLPFRFARTSPDYALLGAATRVQFRRFVDDLLQLLPWYPSPVLSPGFTGPRNPHLPFRTEILAIVAALVVNAAPASEPNGRNIKFREGLTFGRAFWCFPLNAKQG